MPRILRCIVFDIDDTLYLERDYVRSGFNALDVWVEQIFGVPGFGKSAWEAFLEGVRGNTIDVAFREIGMNPDEKTIRDAVEMYREHSPGIELLPDSRELLDALKGAVKMAAVTDGPSASQAAKAKALNLSTWCDPVVLTAELGTEFSKPHPRAFQVIEEMHGVVGHNCLYAADNPNKDFQGPGQRGWLTVRIRREGGLHEQSEGSYTAKMEVPTLGHLQRELLESGEFELRNE